MNILGFAPSQIWKRGEKKPRVDKLYPSNGFRIRKVIQNPKEKDLLIQDFLSEYFSAMKKIRNADSTARINFTCALYGYTDEGLFLEPDFVVMLAETRSELNYDLYVWNQDDCATTDGQVV